MYDLSITNHNDCIKPVINSFLRVSSHKMRASGVKLLGEGMPTQCQEGSMGFKVWVKIEQTFEGRQKGKGYTKDHKNECLIFR